MKRYDVTILEDEIAFIALHIGAEIERQKIDENKIKAIIICPNYYKISFNVENQLLFYFGNQISIIKTINLVNEKENLIQEIKGENIDVIFSTVPLAILNNYKWIQISPFNFVDQISHIQNTLSKIQEKKQIELLNANLNDYLDQDLFFINNKVKDKYDAITLLCSQLEQQNKVAHSFRNNVLLRENVASTVFGSIALPHSIEMEAYKTSIAILLSKDGIIWDKNTVYITFLLAINKNDCPNFRHLYELFITLFSDSLFIEQIKKAQSYEEFIKLINIASQNL